MKEIKADAAELKADVEFEVGDSAYRMRKVGIKPLQHLDALPIHAIHDLKLLRRFHDLIISTSIEENEECPICMDNLENNKCARSDYLELPAFLSLQLITFFRHLTAFHVNIRFASHASQRSLPDRSP